MKYVPYILCGGSGSRLAPLSTPEKPKPFLDLLDTGRTLLQETVNRFNYPYIICNHKHTALVSEQVGGHVSGIIAEQTSRNTGYAVHTAALHCPDDKLCLIVPADHYISDTAAFLDDLEKCVDIAEADQIATIGIDPTSPSTEYGYVDYNGKFCEKPNEKTAEYLIGIGYLWNTGIYMFKPKIMRLLFKTMYPDFRKIGPFKSIDKLIMQETNYTRPYPAGFKWSDLGTIENIEKLKRVLHHEQKDNH